MFSQSCCHDPFNLLPAVARRSAVLAFLSCFLPCLAGPLAAVTIEPVCSGVRPAVALGIRPPAPPTVTDLSHLSETDVCHVSNTLELQNAVLNCPDPDIILRPGIYAPDDLNGTFLSFPETRRLWVSTPGTAILQFGISMGSHPGSELHGLLIDITDFAHGVPIGPIEKNYRGAVVYWGASGTDIRIHDTEILGHGVLHVGILGGHADGTDIQRVGIEGFLRFGIRLNRTWPSPVTAQARVSDIVVRDVIDLDWQDSDTYNPGAEEHGIWIGLPTRLVRAQVRDVFWSGIITGNCVKLDDDNRCDGDVLTNVQMIDVDVDRIGVAEGLVRSRAGSGISFERVTTNTAVRRFCVGPETEQGIHAEWNSGFNSDSARGLKVLTGVISSHRVGVFFGSGTHTSTLQSVHFIKSPVDPNVHWAAVGLNCSSNPLTCSTVSSSDLTYDAGVCCHEARGFYDQGECCAGPCDVGMCMF